MEKTNPKTIREAIDELQIFFISDMWWACKNEWKSKKDMIEYLDSHFGVFRIQMLSLNHGSGNEVKE